VEERFFYNATIQNSSFRVSVERLALNLSIGVWIGVQGNLADALIQCILIFFLLDT
jgi:hypothetical protein